MDLAAHEEPLPVRGGRRAPALRLCRRSQGSTSGSDSHSPSLHGPGARLFVPLQGRARLPLFSYPSRGALAGCVALTGDGESFTPTRSTRAPLVMGPLPRRPETPTMRGADPFRGAPITIPPHEPRPREGLELADPESPLARGRPGPRAASPAPPRRGPGSAAPEVPSIDEPAGWDRSPTRRHGRRSSRMRPLPVRPAAEPRSRASWLPGTNPEWARKPTWSGCPQVVGNLWRTSSTFFDLAGTSALDGAEDRRPGGASSGG